MTKTKVVVYGKSEAGKSTLVRMLAPEAVNIDHNGRTVAMDYGVIQFEDCSFHFFGTPGQPHFRPVREVISLGMDTAVFVVDSTRCFDEEDRELLFELTLVNVPYVIFLNQKPQRSYEKSAIEAALQGFSWPVCIVEGSAKTGEGVEDLLGALKYSAGLRAPK